MRQRTDNRPPGQATVDHGTARQVHGADVAIAVTTRAHAEVMVSDLIEDPVLVNCLLDHSAFAGGSYRAMNLRVPQGTSMPPRFVPLRSSGAAVAGRCRHQPFGSRRSDGSPERPAPPTGTRPSRPSGGSRAGDAGLRLRAGHPFPGTAGAAWECVCTVCGRTSRPNVSKVRGGHRCPHSDSGAAVHKW